jgi:hypothetical protein
MTQIRFGNIDTNTGLISTVDARQEISISWTSNPEKLYTVILYDLDYPLFASQNSGSSYLNLLITNVKGSNISTGTSLVDYESPSPPVYSFPHNYNLDVYIQPSYIRPVQHTVRQNFDLSGFTKRHGLILMSRNSFKVGQKVPTAGSVTSENSGSSADRKAETTRFFLPDTSLSEKQQKWCKCVIKVADKQRGACNTEKAWFETRDGQECYNPYAVCSKSIGTSTRECGKNYDFRSFSDNHLITYAQLHQKDKSGINIQIPEPYNRDEMLSNIKRWKELKEK